ncbi:hypothetical protein Ancab_012542 [Ancistrocladus abbreviatus]
MQWSTSMVETSSSVDVGGQGIASKPLEPPEVSFAWRYKFRLTSFVDSQSSSWRSSTLSKVLNLWSDETLVSYLELKLSTMH